MNAPSAARPAIETITLRTAAAPAAGAEAVVGAEPAVAPPAALRPTAAQPARTAAVTPEAVDFGLFDGSSLAATRDRLAQALQEFATRLGAALQRAVDNAASLEVTTYVSDDMTRVTKEFEQTANLRAYTRINLDGDTTVCVPKQASEIDKDLWSIHLDMVKQAQANRTEMIKAAVAAATGLFDALKGV